MEGVSATVESQHERDPWPRALRRPTLGRCRLPRGRGPCSGRRSGTRTGCTTRCAARTSRKRTAAPARPASVPSDRTTDLRVTGNGPRLATPTVRRRVHATRPRSPSAAPARVAEVVQASWPPLLQRSSPRIRCPGKRVRLRTLRWVVRAAARPMPVSAELTLPRRGGGGIDWDPGGRVLRRGSRRCRLERGCGRTRWQR
jgi:hypothetical protein